MYIIAGLGNPTQEYAGTRHNIGFEAISALSEAWRIPVEKKEARAVVGKGYLRSEKILLCKPQTFMNLSGESLRVLAEYYRVAPDNIIVICDDINLPLGQLRIRPSGSAGGHNGLKNIIQNLGTEGFIRIRVGVGEKPLHMDLADYVLGRFGAEEKPVIRNAVNDVVGACETIFTKGIAAAMEKYNRKDRLL